MSAIFGHLNISDLDRTFVNTVGQRVVWEAATAYVDRANAEIQQLLGTFVERTTSDFKFRYKLPGGGYLQMRGLDGRYGSVKATGNWDVAFPLRDYGAQISGNDVAMAYMTLAELERHINTVVLQDLNTVRYQILHRLFKSTDTSFADDINGTLTIMGLANGDAVVYPPKIGATTEATDNHYLESGYAASAIDNTNDPYPVLVRELKEHFPGASTRGIVTFINSAESPETEALASFYEVGDPAIRQGANADVPFGPPADVPGDIIGRHKAGTWISEWDSIPAGWSLTIHTEAEAPLIMRVDDPATGLGMGLQLVSRDQEFPFEASFWRHRFGFGVGNRLNGVVMEFGSGGTYTAPTDYA
jgi:hypothetical protein